jgi:hypothetical protein
VKKLSISLLTVILIVAGGAYWLHFHLDGVVKDAITHYGSAMTQTKVEVDSVEIRAHDGTGVIRGLRVANPPEFKTPYAVQVAAIEVSLDINSLTKDVVLVKRIGIEAPDVIYEKAGAVTNFDVLQKNITHYLGASEKRETSGKRLIVEELRMRDGQARASAAVLQGQAIATALPDLELRDLGKDKGGVSPGELGQEIVSALRHKLAIAVSLDKLAESAASAIDKVGNVLKGLFNGK